ncbi:MAG: hypothetical protein NVS1B4_21540 [Gemmatimonadaceae bacterium]
MAASPSIGLAICGGAALARTLRLTFPAPHDDVPSFRAARTRPDTIGRTMTRGGGSTMARDLFGAVALVAFVACAPLGLGAQSPASGGGLIGGASIFAPGTRVRLIVAGLRDRTITGTVYRYGVDTLVVDTADVAETRRTFFPSTTMVERYRRVSLPLADVDSVNVSVGRSRLLGMAISGAKYAAIGGIMLGLKNVSGRSGPTLREFGQGAAVGAIAGVTIGMSFGYARGAEQWKRIPYFGGIIRRHRDHAPPSETIAQ